MKYFVTTIASLLATIVAARGGEKAPPAATDDGNIMSRVLALEKIVEEQRVQLEDVHDVVSSLHSRRTQIDKCFKNKGRRIVFTCKVMMRKSLEVMEEFTVKGDSGFHGGNVFITNGKDGLDELNGKGNLIVGGKSADVVANPGSHNVIIGFEHKYSAFGGLVAGWRNEISKNYASVTGGAANIASGYASSISGGHGNKATAIGSSISGGQGNKATGGMSSVCGGLNSQANGETSSVSGGANNEANGRQTSVTGGAFNVAAGEFSSIGGGKGNRTPYAASVVTGTQDKETKSNYENLP